MGKDSAQGDDMTTKTYETDTIHTSAGDLEITFLGHGSLMMKFGGQVMYIDPYSQVADYASLPPADMIFLTHEHGDHLDPSALQHVRTSQTLLILTEICAQQLEGGTVLRNGDSHAAGNIRVEAVPAYNIQNKRPNGQPFHPKGDGNGYILTFGDTRVYVAGDTENTPEMKALLDIEVAFLPMNLPYTMTPEMIADAARAFKPRILYPYHYGKTDPAALEGLLRGQEQIEVRVRQMA
jgi:L-ascorbate metabolism protein UlaG (beta-lactamase superfamily)